MYRKIVAEPLGEGDVHTLFLDAWTRREAAFKKRGTGVFSAWKKCDGEADARAGTLLTFDELYLAFCGEHAAQAEIYLCDTHGGKTLISECFNERK